MKKEQGHTTAWRQRFDIVKKTAPHIPKGPLPAHVEEETWGRNRLAQVTWKRAVNMDVESYMDVESCYVAAVHVLNHKTVTIQQVRTDHG